MSKQAAEVAKRRTFAIIAHPDAIADGTGYFCRWYG